MSLKILVFDQSVALTGVLKEIAMKREFDVITANNISLALFLCRKNFPSLIAIQFPTKSSEIELELVHDIRADNDLDNVPILAVLNGESSILETELWRAGVNDFFSSDLTIADLSMKLQNYLVEPEDDRCEETTE